MSTLRELLALHHLVPQGEPCLGPFDDLPLPDEEQAAVRIRADQWCSSLKPMNATEMWLLEQVAVQALRLERCQIDEATRRDALARRAIEGWEDDRRREAEDLAARLRRSPAAVARHLRATKAGAAWLLARWATLQAPLDAGTPWTPAQRTLALDLLATPADARDAPAAVDLPAADLLALVASEIDRLRAHHDGPLADLDRHDRACAARGLGPAIDAALAPLRRNERSVARRMEWLLGRFQSGRRNSRSAASDADDDSGPDSYAGPGARKRPAYTPPGYVPPTGPPAYVDPDYRPPEDAPPPLPAPAKKIRRRALGAVPLTPPSLNPRRPLPTPGRSFDQPAGEGRRHPDPFAGLRAAQPLLGKPPSATQFGGRIQPPGGSDASTPRRPPNSSPRGQ